MTSPPALFSPVVGEFKGWFSNLFNWKAQTYVLYSPDDALATRDETMRLLFQFGVIVGVEDSDGGTVLRCRVNDTIDPMTGSVIQKRTFFRIEFASPLGADHSHGGLSSPQAHYNGEPPTPYTPTGGFSSPIPNSARPSLLNKNILMKMQGYMCAIVLVQEKGSMSTFRMVYKRLKEEWRLDSRLQSPGVGMGGGATPLMEYASKFTV
jgi:hypothetical protein